MKPRLWPGMIFALLGLNVAVVTVTVVVANSDPSFGVEPRYDSNAAAWNDTVRQREANLALGWSARPPLPVTRGAPLCIILIDRDGSPLVGAAVTAEAFAHARSRDRHRATLSEIAPGEYRADDLAPQTTGVWEVRVRAVRANDIFTSDSTIVVVAPERSP